MSRGRGRDWKLAVYQEAGAEFHPGWGLGRASCSAAVPPPQLKAQLRRKCL